MDRQSILSTGSQREDSHELFNPALGILYSRRWVYRWVVSFITGQTYKDNHRVSNFGLNGTPRPSIHEGILAELTRGPQSLKGEVDEPMVPRRIRVRPWSLADSCPDPGFGDVGGGLVVP